MVNVCLIGIGRTGSVVAEQLLNSPDFELTAVVAKPGSPKIGRRLGELIPHPSDLVVADAGDLAEVIKRSRCKVAIDFTNPEATLDNARILAEHGVHIVVGTTGFKPNQVQELKNLVQRHRVGLVYAPNISVGINLLLSIVKTVTRLVPQYDVEITEACHRDKRDVPSGTALKLAGEIGMIKKTAPGGKSRNRGTEAELPRIGIHSLRAGGVIGVHQVLFAGESDELEITHRSYSRAIYAEGALKAAAFVAGLRGFFHMEDVLLAERMERDLRVAANRLYLNFNS
jgi:4-hydroxy-tetrahydrodipicolinate reductase